MFSLLLVGIPVSHDTALPLQTDQSGRERPTLSRKPHLLARESYIMSVKLDARTKTCAQGGYRQLTNEQQVTLQQIHTVWCMHSETLAISAILSKYVEIRKMQKSATIKHSIYWICENSVKINTNTSSTTLTVHWTRLLTKSTHTCTLHEQLTQSISRPMHRWYEEQAVNIPVLLSSSAFRLAVC